MSNRTKGTLYIILSALGFGSYGVWSRLVSPFGALFQSWTRGIIIVVIIFPILYFSEQIVPIERKDYKWMAIFLTATSLTIAPIFYAFNHMDIGTASLIFFTSQLLAMYIVGLIFLNEKLNLIKIVSFIIALLGLYFTFSFSIANFALLALLMATLNGVASGVELSSSKKFAESYSALYIIWLSWIAVTISNLFLFLVLGKAQPIPTLYSAWLYLIGYAVFSIVSFWLAVEGLKYVEASIGALLGLLEIVFSIAFGILIFHESLTPKIIIGALFILCAAALPHVKQLKLRNK